MPLSKVDENMRRAHKRGAVTEEVFFFEIIIPLAEECGQSEGKLLTTKKKMHVYQ